MPEPSSHRAHILFVTATRIGDAVFSSGLLDHLIRTHPGAAVTVVAGAPAAPLFHAVPGLERLIVLEKRSFSMHWPWLVKEVWGGRWDVLVDLRAAPLLRLVPAKRRFHFTGGMPKTGTKVAQLAAVIGMGDAPPLPRLWVSDADRRRAEALIPPGAPVLAVGPVANWKPKTWAAENFARLIARITADGGFLPGARVAFFGHESEHAAAATAVASVPPDRRIDLIGPLSLPEVGACLMRSAFFVGNDSGLTHMAAAAGIPTLGLFGPTRDDVYGPYGPKSAVARTERSFAELMGQGPVSPDADLMAGLSVDRAYDTAVSLWRRVGGGAA